MRRSVRVFAPAIGNSARSGVRTPPPRRTPGSGVRTPDLAELRSEEHTSELQSLRHLVCRLLLGKEKHKSELQSLRHLVSRRLLGTTEHTAEEGDDGCPIGFRRPSQTQNCLTAGRLTRVVRSASV